MPLVANIKNCMYKRANFFIEVLVLIVAFILYAYWAVNLPHDMSPDEFMRFDIPYYIFSYGELPTGGEDALIDAYWGYSYGFTVYGSSLIAIPFIEVMSLFSSEPSYLLIAARFSNVIISVATLAICFRIGNLVFRKQPESVFLFVIFIGFLPQFYFITSYFNNEAFSIFCTALVIYALLYCKKHIWNWKGIVFLGVGVGLTALSYYFAYGVIVAAIVMYFWESIRDPKRRNRFDLIVKPLVIFAIAFGIAGWFFVRNAIIHDGDFLGLATQATYSELYGSETVKPSNRVTPQNQGYSILSMAFSQMHYVSLNWIKATLDSFIGVFGYMETWLPPYLYLIYQAIIITGAFIAVVLFFVQKREFLYKNAPFTVALLLTVVIPWLLSLYYSWSQGFQPQGRYIISGLIPLMLIVVWGYSEFANGLVGKAASQEQQKRCIVVKNGTYAIVLLIWLLLFVAVFLKVIVPECASGIGEVIPTPLLQA